MNTICEFGCVPGISTQHAFCALCGTNERRKVGSHWTTARYSATVARTLSGEEGHYIIPVLGALQQSQHLEAHISVKPGATYNHTDTHDNCSGELDQDKRIPSDVDDHQYGDSHQTDAVYDCRLSINNRDDTVDIGGMNTVTCQSTSHLPRPCNLNTISEKEPQSLDTALVEKRRPPWRQFIHSARAKLVGFLSSFFLRMSLCAIHVVSCSASHIAIPLFRLLVWTAPPLRLNSLGPTLSNDTSNQYDDEWDSKLGVPRSITFEYLHAEFQLSFADVFHDAQLPANDETAGENPEAEQVLGEVPTVRKLEKFESKSKTARRAWTFIKQVRDVAMSHGFETMVIGDMVPVVQRFIEQQSEFERHLKPTAVTIGYHYTKPDRLPSIQENGLTLSERQNLFFGDGLYVGNNPLVFCSYGWRGLMCAILKGKTGRISKAGLGRGNLDTGVGNKKFQNGWPSIDPLFNDEYVLKTSTQCIPLICYQAVLSRVTQSLETKLWACHVDLQKILDAFFNNGVETVPIRVLPSHETWTPVMPTTNSWMPWTPPAHKQRDEKTEDLAEIHYKADAMSREQRIEEAPKYRAVSVSEFATAKSSGGCKICRKSIEARYDVVKLDKCGHIFHLDCADQSLRGDPKCPLCGQLYGQTIQGKSPSGSMGIMWSSLFCDGHQSTSVGSFQIKYRLQSGKQCHYHDNPGVPYHATTRRAFIPYTREAWDLLKRLSWAFQHGLTFTVGTSMASGQANVITWSSIRHKTDRSGGRHGFPDENYFVDANADLDLLDVPPARELSEVIKVHWDPYQQRHVRVATEV